MKSILFVCMGNICRSPIVATIARAHFARAQLDILVDSAGTEDYHVGDRADARSIASATAHGYDATAHRARRISAADCANFDAILVMDAVNLRALERDFSVEQRTRVALFLPFANVPTPLHVPDPYYGQPRDFDLVIELAQRGADGLIARFAHT